MQVSLTDDELVALCLTLKVAWRSPLPTVASNDEDALITALPRGLRSLVARGLATPGEATMTIDAELRESLRPALGAVPWFSMFVVDDRMTYVPDGPTAIFYRDTAVPGVLRELVSAAGIHEFTIVSVEDALGGVGTLLEGVRQNGIEAFADGEPRPDLVLSLCVAGTPDQGATMVMSSRQRLRIVEVAVDATTRDLGDAPDVSAALGRVIPEVA